MRNNTDTALIAKLNEDYTKITDVAKEYARLKGEPYTDSLRRHISNHISRLSEKEVEEQSTTTAQYTKEEVLSARKADGTIMSIEEYCDFYGLPLDQVRSYKLVTHTGTPYYNIASRVLDDEDGNPWDILNDRVASVVEKCLASSSLKPLSFYDPKDVIEIIDSEEEAFLELNLDTEYQSSKKALRVILTDIHIGLDVGNGGNALYDGKWDEEEIERRRQIVVEKVFDKMASQQFEEVHILDLGDLSDGWDGATTRGNAHLQQNMDNEAQFDCAVQFKIKLLADICAMSSVKVKLFSICNDNHAGSFAYVINSAVKQIGEAMFGERVEITNVRKFIDHYTYGDHTFIICHGKDSTHQKYGFPPKLDDKARSKIEEYMKRHSLYNRDKYVTFEKGDSHVQIFDEAGSNDFSYNSYITFAPPSQWAQHNFVGSKSGFNLMVVDKEKNEKELTTYFF